MSSFLQLVLALTAIILCAKAASLISIRLGQPSVLGELLVGILLGPTLLDLTHLPFVTNTHLTEVLIELGELGVLLLMFIAGLELHLSELARNPGVCSGWRVGRGPAGVAGLGLRCALWIQPEQRHVPGNGVGRDQCEHLCPDLDRAQSTAHQGRFGTPGGSGI